MKPTDPWYATRPGASFNETVELTRNLRDYISQLENGHQCACRDYPCKCGVYTDKHGDWCANENCRARV